MASTRISGLAKGLAYTVASSVEAQAEGRRVAPLSRERACVTDTKTGPPAPAKTHNAFIQVTYRKAGKTFDLVGKALVGVGRFGPLATAHRFVDPGWARVAAGLVQAGFSVACLSGGRLTPIQQVRVHTTTTSRRRSGSDGTPIVFITPTRRRGSAAKQTSTLCLLRRLSLGRDWARPRRPGRGLS